MIWYLKEWGLIMIHYKNMKMIFNKNKTINVNNINICNGIPINFNNEPLLGDFKNYVFDNFKLKRKVESKKNILFILRRGKREITNTNDVKTRTRKYK